MPVPLPESLVQIDQEIWYYLNVKWRNDFLDAVIPYFRNQWTWAPLYLFLLVFMLGNFKRTGLIWCFFFLATFALADQVSAHWLKPVFERVRPCNDPYLSKLVNIIVPCGGGYSFPSSHAANHFALGIFAAMTLQRLIKGIWWIAMFWAISISYAQVYVGVHFPVDVVCGGFIGAVAGMITASIFRWKFSLQSNYTPSPR